MRPRSRWIGGILILLVAAAVLVGSLLKPGPGSARAAPSPGHPAPQFSLPDVHGKQVALSAQRGHVVLVNFWATWCIPCRSELPLISRTLQAHSSLRVLAVDKQEPAADVAAYARSLDLTFTPIIDGDLSVFDRYRVSNIQPVSFWIDRAGIVKIVKYGPMDAAFVKHELRTLNVS